jgi:hypothetical protein
LLTRVFKALLSRTCSVGRAYYHWAIGRTTWWGKTLAVGGPVLLLVALVSSVEIEEPTSPTTVQTQQVTASSSAAVQATSTSPSSIAPTSVPTVQAQIEAATPSPMPTSSPESTSTSPTPAPPTATSRPVPPSPTPAPRAAAFADLDLTELSVKNVLTSSKLIWLPFDLGRPESIEIAGGQILLTYMWDYSANQTDLVTNGGYAAYNASRTLFANRRVTTVAVKLRSHYADKLGNRIIEPSTTIVMRRSTADRADWDGLGVLVLKDNKRMFCAGDQWFIHPLIYDLLKDKGCLGSSQATRVQ